MAKPTLTAISGDAVTTMLIPGTSLEVQLVAEVDADGHIIGSRPTYTVWFPPATVATNRELGEIFNAAAAEVVRMRGIWIVSTNTVLATACQFAVDINRTTTVGTTSSVVRTSRKLDKGFSHTLHASITCRDSATAGATLDHIYWPNYQWNDETSTGAALGWAFNSIPVLGDRVVEIVLRQNEGVQAKISSVAGTAAGLVGCLMHFAVDN